MKMLMQWDIIQQSPMPMSVIVRQLQLENDIEQPSEEWLHSVS
ncbi:hypothetical protein [Thermoflavimicrobium daqui]|jgi:hypothetical protein|nr:hypothetical protein [Thermoflavimicrobium daqui]